MKKEIKELLNQSEGNLQINELFLLKRRKVRAEDDVLGRELDILQLEMTNKYGATRASAIVIESRDIKEIMEEVEIGIDAMMEELKQTLIRYWKGGYLF